MKKKFDNVVAEAKREYFNEVRLEKATNSFSTGFSVGKSVKE